MRRAEPLASPPKVFFFENPFGSLPFALKELKISARPSILLRKCCCPFVMDKSFQERNSGDISPISAKNVAQIWQRFLPIFVLPFPGKVGARNFTKNPRPVSRPTKQNSFTARLWELGGPTFSERAKGAEKESCGETVSQKGAFGESVSSLPP